jgi:hypothetical protein
MTIKNLFSTLGTLLLTVIIFIVFNWVLNEPQLLPIKDLNYILVYCVGWFTRGWCDEDEIKKEES